MQRVSRLAIFAFVFGAFVCQAQTSPSTAASHSRVADSDAALGMDGACADNDGASTNGKVMEGFEFLRRIDKRVINEFAHAWQSSGSGNTGRESVVLIFRMTDGSFSGISQGSTYEYHKFTFCWRSNALAIVHTHPNSCDPKPSPHDERVAEQYVPVFNYDPRYVRVQPSHKNDQQSGE
jgi:hypothetical protein